MEFDNFEELSVYVKKISEETFSVFSIVDCRTVENANKRIATGRTKYHARFKYSYVKFGCKHFGIAKSHSTGIRPNQRTYKTGCACFIYASVDRNKDKLVVIRSDLKHNHDTSKELYMSYPEQRRVSDDQKRLIEELQNLKVPSDAICQHLQDVHGKHSTVKDIHNIRKEKKVVDRPCDENDNQVTSEHLLSVAIIKGGDTMTSEDSGEQLSQIVSHAVQQLENELESDKESVRANIKSASQFPKLFYTTSASEAYEVIESYELKTNSKFIMYEESQSFGQNEPLHVMACYKGGKAGSKHKVKYPIVWEDHDTALAKDELIPYDGIPYMQLGRKICDCHLRVLGRKPNMGTSKRKSKTSGSGKAGCTARVSLREIHKFPEFKVEEGFDSDYYRSQKTKEIWKAILNREDVGERRIYVSLPSVADHSGHHVTRVDNFLTNPKVKKKIYELACQNIFGVEELQEKTKEFVEKDLFQEKSLPSQTDRRFYPSNATFESICYLARLKMREEGIPVPVPVQHHRNRKRDSLPNVTDVPPVAHEVTVETSADETASSPPHSPSSPSFTSSTSERLDNSADFFNALEEVRCLALKVSDETLFEEVRQNVFNIRKRLLARCNEERSEKRQRLDEDTEEMVLGPRAYRLWLKYVGRPLHLGKLDGQK